MTVSTSRPILPVILSGGSGTRLWPLSRAAQPKQLLDLLGDGSMLALTAARVAASDLFAPPLVVTSAAQAEAVAGVLPDHGGLILEPTARNTAPAIALAALAADPDDVLLVLPSDHLIADVAGFREAVRRALPFAEEGWLVTFGMKAERAETGYGYIERGERIGDGVHAAARFVEKPDPATAQAYVEGGRHDWNGGIFLMRAGAYLAALEAHAPAVASACRAAMAGASRDGDRIEPDAAAFAAAPSISIDYAVMERADRIALVPVAVGWSDVGSWDALYDVSSRDEAGNAISGEVVVIGARNCLIRSNGPLVAAIGIEDMVVVATADAVLVMPKAQSQKVKDAVEAIRAKGRDSCL